MALPRLPGARIERCSSIDPGPKFWGKRKREMDRRRRPEVAAARGGRVQVSGGPGGQVEIAAAARRGEGEAGERRR